jgi:hypothetical protein
MTGLRHKMGDARVVGENHCVVVVIITIIVIIITHIPCLTAVQLVLKRPSTCYSQFCQLHGMH